MNNLDRKQKRAYLLLKVLLRSTALESWGLKKVVFCGHSLAAAQATILHSDVVEGAQTIEDLRTVSAEEGATVSAEDLKTLEALTFRLSDNLRREVTVESTGFALPPVWAKERDSATRHTNPVNALTSTAFVHSSDMVPPVSRFYEYTNRELEWSLASYKGHFRKFESELRSFVEKASADGASRADIESIIQEMKVIKTPLQHFKSRGFFGGKWGDIEK